jgi:two-component SAPR family response regulator
VQALIDTCILVVEDEYLIAEEIAYSLTRAGSSVLGPCATCSEGLELIAGNLVDAAVLDISLKNGQSVYPLAERLAKRGIPFVFYTGYDRGHVRSDFASRACLVKPAERNNLVSAVAQVILNRA